MEAHNPHGIFYPKFCLPLAEFQIGWVFQVNGKQPWCPEAEVNSSSS
jgi:cytochrome bd-type quinol oxidase subunit 1